MFEIGCPAVKLIDGPLDPLQVRTVRKYQIMTGSVCGTWRQISHQTPGLWTSIIVWRGPKLWSRQSGEMLDAAIRYSGNLDLDLYLHDPIMRYKEAQPSAPDDVISAILARVQKLVLQMADGRSYGLSMPLRKAPRLRHFELSGGGANLSSTFMEEPSAPLEIFRSANNWVSFNLLSIPAERLKSLVYGGWSTRDDFEAFAMRCRQLERLTLTQAPPYINMAQWSSVRIADLKFPIVPPVLSTLSMTHLVHVALRLPLRMPDQEPDRTRIGSWRALPALRSLSVIAGMEWAQDIADVLDRASNLITFETEARLARLVITYFIRAPASTISPLGDMRLLRVIQPHVDASGYPGSSVDYAWWNETLSQERSPKLKLEWWYDDELRFEVQHKFPAVLRAFSMHVFSENITPFPLSELGHMYDLETE